MTKLENPFLKAESSSFNRAAKLNDKPSYQNLHRIKRSDLSTSEQSSSSNSSNNEAPVSKFRRHTLSSLNKRILTDHSCHHNQPESTSTNMLRQFNKKVNHPSCPASEFLASGSKSTLSTSYKKNDGLKGRVGGTPNSKTAATESYFEKASSHNSRNKNYNWTYTGSNFKKDIIAGGVRADSKSRWIEEKKKMNSMFLY